MTGEEDRNNKSNRPHRQDSMFRIFKALITFVLFAFLGLVAYAYLGDLKPMQSDVSQPVELNVGQ
jgi:hypothetical protein